MIIIIIIIERIIGCNDKDTNNQDLGELLNAEPLGALSSHLALGTRWLLITVEGLDFGKVLEALIELNRAASRWYRQTKIPKWIEGNGNVIARCAM